MELNSVGAISWCVKLAWEEILMRQHCILHQNKRNLANALSQMGARSQLTQAQVAARMATTQTAIARLESGRQSPSMQTLQNYARANGYCLEIGFVRSQDAESGTGCILVVEAPGGPKADHQLLQQA
jgi:transcriptional regulator with XRE-family HTH domain